MNNKIKIQAVMPLIFKGLIVLFLIASVYNNGVNQTSAVVENVTWTSLVNATASGGTITSGSNPVAGGGVSSQSITSGDGYMEFTVLGTDGNRAGGLTNNSANQELEDMDFAVRLNGAGSAEIWESANYRTETTYTTNNIFRVEIVSGQVRYKKNGSVFYTSSVAPTYPLKADSAIYNSNTSISNAIISYGAADTTPPTISSVASSAITSFGATITWSTNEASDTQVEYGTTISYGSSTTLNASMVTSHSQGLSALSASTLYHYRVKSKDAANNLATSGDFTFTTSAPAGDTTSPTVSISSPTGGATITGTISITVNASDNVGVAGVQFRLDGNNIGIEDTTAPYSYAWDSTQATNGSHTWTASARDAAGNTTTSAGRTVTVSNVVTPPPPSGDILFESNWTTATGNSPTALLDGKWTYYDVGGSIASNPNMLNVVTTTAPPGLTHSLRVQQQGSTASNGNAWGGVVKENFTPASQDYYLRYYYRTDDVNGVRGSHVVQPVGPDGERLSSIYGDLVYLSQLNYSGGWSIRLSLGANKPPFQGFLPNWQMANSTALSYGEWYRIEYHVDFTATNRIRLFIRIYDDNNVLLFDEGDFIADPDWGALPAGATLTQLYSGQLSSYVGGATDFTITPSNLVNIEFGNNGSATATNTGLYWYYAGVQIRSDTWPGPVGGSTPTDTTAPTVSISAPAAGSIVSGTALSVTATASDNVGVAGVQFRIDGSNIGTEDTTAPYSYTWDTTLATNALHTWTAVARDAAGNTTTSAGISVTVNNVVTPPPPPGGIVFDSDWSTATGLATNTLTDGGKWDWHADFGGCQLLSVVPSTQAPGGPAVTNVLKVLQKGSGCAANVQVNDVVPAATNWYLRYYMRNDDTSSAGDHIVTVDTYSYANITFMRKYGGGSGFTFDISLYGCGYTYPIGHWRSAQTLSNSQWYRFEYWIEYINSTHIKIHPRVYNSAGTLIMSDAEFRQSDYGGATWNGRSDWTLASYYAAGHNFCVDPNARADAGGHSLRNFGLGNNGQAGAANTGLPWYFAGVQIRTDTWPGAIGGVTPPPPPPPPPPANQTPVGAFDEIRLSDGVIRGWSYDPNTSSSSNNVHIYIDGPAGGGGTLLSGFATNVLRSDVNSSFGITGNHGFEYIIPAAYRNGVSHSIYVYGIDTSNAAISALLTGSPKSFTLSVTPPPPPPPPASGIASSYPGDVGIENDPNVVWVEKFNQANLSTVTSRYNDVKGSSNMSLTSDVPTGSGDSQSLTITGGNPDGGHLFKQITPAVTDTLYVRYYIKHPVSGSYSHSGVWMGGYNPPLTFPNPQAGVKPAGNDRFSASAENNFSGATRFDHYDYWMNMRPDGTGTYWGNTLLNNPSVDVRTGQWDCVEHMVKLNNPVSSFNGEHAIWLNGVKVSHLGMGFPNGTWSGGNFTQGSGSPFEGFQWRNNSNLNLNYIWLQNYAPTSPFGTLKYDNLVAAKNYIGCISAAATPPPPPAPIPVVGDINNDHIVNSIDYSILNSRWFTNDATADLNDDNIVNAIDYSILNSNWFKTW
jgi:hypothetical protein